MAIDAALVAGVGYRTIAARFNVGRSSVTRHSKSHLSPAQRAALMTAAEPLAIDADALAEREGTNLLSHVAAQRQRLLADADAARQLGDVPATVAAERALTGTLVVTGKLVGQFTTKIDVRHSHVLLDPQWLRMRQAIVVALRGHPNAMRAVAAAMQALEADAARDITASAHKGRAAPPLIEHDPVTPPPIVDVLPSLPPCPVPLP
jgi:hypothetical protein